MTRPRPSAGSIDLTSLRLLVAVVEEGNLARAAAREHIAVSAVSRRIANLETRYGVTLLHRHDRGVVATPAAEAVIDRVRVALELLGQIADDLGELRDGSRGLIRIQAHTTAASGLLPGLIAAFLADHPAVDISIDEATSVEIVNAIRHGACDLGLVSGTVDAGELELLPWGRDELVAVLPPDSPLAAHASLTLAQMLDQPFIGMHRDSALVMMHRSQAAAMAKPMIERAHVTSFDVAGKMVGQGLGVAILPAEAGRLAADHYGAIVRPLAESWARRPLMLCVRDLARTPAATRLLIDFLRRHTPGDD